MQANLLLVDDRPENLLALSAILEPLDCRLVQAASGPQALKNLLNHEFALILMDVQMPGMDGFETARLIKEREKSRFVPIIFVTALSKEQHYIFEGYSAGAVDYISKPFNPDILRSKVSVFVDLWQKSEQVKQSGEILRRNQQLEQERELAALERELEQRHLHELAESEARLQHFKSTLDATLDSILMFDPQTLHFSYVNQGTLRHLGYSREEMLQMTPVTIKPDLSEIEFRAMLEPLRDQTRSLTFETLHSRKDGTQVPVEVFLQFIAPDGENGLFLSFVRDISERKTVEAALIGARDSAEQERARAERANRAKSDFIAGVSHELRTPLNAILGFSKLLLNPRVGPLNTNQNAYVQDVVHSAEHLLQLINDILDLSKIEAGKMTLEMSSFDLNEMLEQSLVIVREKAHAHGLKLSVDVSPKARKLSPIEGDARKIKQVMFNLLSNAVKFTPDGGNIWISADCETDDTVTISVRDSGIGIAPENQERIFQAFEQVDNSYARQQQGTGLGLALTKRIVEMHGGQLRLESRESQGSTFSFTLPAFSLETSTEINNEGDADLQSVIVQNAINVEVPTEETSLPSAAKNRKTAKPTTAKPRSRVATTAKTKARV